MNTVIEVNDLQRTFGENKAVDGMTFAVEPPVLIPRPETELMVEEAVRIIRNAGKGTGTEKKKGNLKIALYARYTLTHQAVCLTGLDLPIRNAPRPIQIAWKANGPSMPVRPAVHAAREKTPPII